MNRPGFRRDFARDYETAYELTFGPNPKSENVQWHQFPPGATDGVTVTVRTGTGEWVGTFARDSDDPNAVTCVQSLPNPNEVCVVAGGAGYVVDVLEPDNWHEIEATSIRGVRAVPEHRLVLLSDLTSVIALDERGLRWKTPRISWDGVQLVAVHGAHAWGRVWDAPNDRAAIVRLDLQTGEAVGAIVPPPYEQ